MESLNRMAIELVDEAIDFTAELDIGAFELENGATVLDFGVDHAGGLEAGMLLAEIQTAGLATIQTGMGEVQRRWVRGARERASTRARGRGGRVPGDGVH